MNNQGNCGNKQRVDKQPPYGVQLAFCIEKDNRCFAFRRFHKIAVAAIKAVLFSAFQHTARKAQCLAFGNRGDIVLVDVQQFTAFAVANGKETYHVWRFPGKRKVVAARRLTPLKHRAGFTFACLIKHR